MGTSSHRTKTKVSFNAGTLVIPLNKRKANCVDLLRGEIKEAQKACAHEYRLFEPLKLKKTLVAEAFDGQEMDKNYVETQCLRCSTVKRIDAKKECPFCLGKMKQGAFSQPEKYFGAGHYSYYAAVPHRCDSCNLTLVFLIWDQ